MPSKTNLKTKLHLGKITVDAVTQDHVLETISEHIQSKKGGYLVTPNVDHVVLAERNAELRQAYDNATLSVADGKPIVWASYLLGKPLPQKISGSDLFIPLMRLAEKKRWRVYLLGGSIQSNKKAKLNLKQMLPNINIVGRSCRYIDLDHEETSSIVLKEIKALNVDLLIVCLGCPKQEIWMNRYRAAYSPAFALGLGASIDFVAGVAKRSPKFISDMGFEWLFRLLHEPRRLWKRYLLRDPQFLRIFIHSLTHQQNRRSVKPC